MPGSESESAGDSAWRRVGLLVPSSNTVMEVDFYRRLPPGFTLHTGRMYLESTTPEGESAMLDHHVTPAAHDVGTARPDVIVFGCTSAGALRGIEYDRELCERIAADAGADVLSVISSVREAIRSRGARRIGVITPYVESLNEKIRASLEADEGVEVADIRGLGISENFAIAEVPPEKIVAFAAETFQGQRIDLLFASCTNFRAMDAVEGIKDALGVDALTSNLAALEAVYRWAGLELPGPEEP
jgi:maleate isomerase